MPKEPRSNDRHFYHFENGKPIFESTAEVERKDFQNDENKFKKQQLDISKQNLLTQVGLVVFGLLGTATGAYQAHTSKVSADAARQASETAAATLKEMRTGSGASDTHTLAMQAVTQAAQTTLLAEAAKRQADQTEKLAEDSVLQANAANSLAVQAQRSADYAKQSIEAALEADRPWVGIESHNCSTCKSDHGNFSMSGLEIIIKNTGRIPANEVKLEYYSHFLEPQNSVPSVDRLTSEDLQIQEYSKSIPRNMTETFALNPNATHQVKLGVLVANLDRTKMFREDLVNYVFGKLTYRGREGTNYRTDFCFVNIFGDLTGFRFCDEGNDMR